MGKTLFVCPGGCGGINLVKSGFAVTCRRCGRMATRMECTVRFGSYIPIKPQTKLCTAYMPDQVRIFA